jgi:hypothetical protein
VARRRHNKNLSAKHGIVIHRVAFPSEIKHTFFVAKTR